MILKSNSIYFETESDLDSVFLLMFIEEVAVGAAYCVLRKDYVEGSTTRPVGYLEGISVKKEHRHKRYAKELLKACEDFAKARGASSLQVIASLQ